MKHVRSQGGFVQSGHFSYQGEGFFRCDVRTFSAKTSNFLKFMVRPHVQGELSQCGHFADTGGKGVNFSRFYADVLYQKCKTESEDGTGDIFCIRSGSATVKILTTILKRKLE